MTGRSGGMFAGRGIALPSWWITLLAVLGAFALGIGAGWVTGFVPDLWRAWQAEPEVSASPTPTESAAPDVSVPATAPIDRELDDADREAGLVTLLYPVKGPGTFTAAPGVTTEIDGAGPVRYVRIDLEDGIVMNEAKLVDFVMSTLNDPRGWGSAGRQQFVLTDGVPDVRVVIASPTTVVTTCPLSYAAQGEDDASPAPEGTCAAQGIAPISIYDWAAGLDSYGDDRTGAREYLLQRSVGEVLGNEEGVCESGTASVMADQRDLAEGCTVNPWPFPDAEVPSPSPSATG